MTLDSILCGNEGARKVVNRSNKSLHVVSVAVLEYIPTPRHLVWPPGRAARQRSHALFSQESPGRRVLGKDSLVPHFKIIKRADHIAPVLNKW